MRTNYNINSRSAEQESTCNFKGIEFYEVGVNTRHAHAETELDKSAALPITGQVKKSLWSAVSSLLSRTKFMMIERWLGSQGFMGEDFLKTTSKGDNSRLFSLKNKFRLDHKYSRSHVVKILNNLSKQNNRFYYDLLFMQDERSTGFVKTIFCMKVISTLLFLRQELIHNLANEFGLEHHDPSFKMNYEDTVQDYDIDQNYDFETLWDNKIRVLDERIKTARYYSSHGFSNACLDESNQQTALKKLLNEKKIVEKNADLFRVIYDFQSIIVAYQSSFCNDVIFWVVEESPSQ